MINTFLFIILVLDSVVYEDSAGLTVQQRSPVEENKVTSEKKTTSIRKMQMEVEELKKKIPVSAHEFDDNWFLLFDKASFEKRWIDKGNKFGDNFNYFPLKQLLLALKCSNNEPH